MTFAVQFELICVPLVIVWPDMKFEFEWLFWFCDAIWIVNIVIDIRTIILNALKKDNQDLESEFIKLVVLCDVIATLPSMFSAHSSSIMVLRLFHILNLYKAD